MPSQYIYQVVVTRNGKYRSKWGTKRMVINTMRNIRHRLSDIRVMRVPLDAFEDVTHEFIGDDEE
jgi:hypothetical protein